MTLTDSGTRECFRHTLAVLAYRSAKVFRSVPAGFAGFQTGPNPRTPLQIVAHMADLFEWTISLAGGKGEWHDSVPDGWDKEVARYFDALNRFDRMIAGGEATGCPAERLLQGPMADALTHTGQLAMLRRLAGCPMRGENYFRADIAVGRVGPAQADPVREF